MAINNKLQSLAHKKHLRKLQQQAIANQLDELFNLVDNAEPGTIIHSYLVRKVEALNIELQARD